MAMPMMAGPGAIAAIMLLMNQATGIEESIVVFGAAGVVLLITMASLIAARPLMNLVGTRIEAAITRLLGVLLAALASQFVIDGLRGTLLA
jgi:multiple antibiotic resistance protein